MLNKKNYRGMKSFVRLCAKRAEFVNSWISWKWLPQIKSTFVENKRILKMLELSLIQKLLSNIEILSLILVFLTLEYFKNHYMCLHLKIIKKLTPKVRKGINKWEGQKFLKLVFFSIHLMLIYPIDYNPRLIVPLFYYCSK